MDISDDCNEKDDNHSIASSSVSSASTVTAPQSPSRDTKGDRSDHDEAEPARLNEAAAGLHVSRVSRLHFNSNFQTDQFAKNDNIVFENRKRKNRKYVRRKNLVEDEKDNCADGSPQHDRGFCESARIDQSILKECDKELLETESYEGKCYC